MRRSNVIAGGLVLVFGLAAASIGMTYKLGTPQTLGAGFFPTILGGAAVLLGLAIMIVEGRGQAIAVDDSSSPRRFVDIWPLSVVLGSIIIFALLIRWAGLVPSVICCVAFSTIATGRPSMRRVIVLSLSVAIASVLVFKYGLGLPIAIIGS